MGVVGLTTFTAHVDTVDPDGDPISIVWSDPFGQVGTGAELTFKAGDVRQPFTVTVTDGKGGVASEKVTFVAGTINGAYDGNIGPALGGEYFFMLLQRTGTTITGTLADYKYETEDHHYQVGTVDPGDPGRIDADGRFRLRFKFAPYGGDFAFEGQMVPYDKPITGRFLTDYAFSGRVIGGQFNGQTVIFGEHNPY